MIYRSRLAIAVLIGTLFAVAPVFADGSEDGASQAAPLAPFERLMGGRWHVEGSYQEFEWGVGRRSVISRSYFAIEDTPKLVSEGIWYWHPGEQQIKGIFTAIDMPVVLFDYTTSFEDDKMVNELRSYDADGGEYLYTETWEFTDDSHYNWTLLRTTPEGPQEEMRATYSKMD